MTATVTALPSQIPAWVAMGLDHQTWAKLVTCERNAERYRDQAARYSDRLALARQDTNTPLPVLDRLQGYVVDAFKEAQWWDAAAADVRASAGLSLLQAAE